MVHIANNKGCRYPPIMYTESGRRMTGRLWAETLEELKFAGVESTLKELTTT